MTDLRPPTARSRTAARVGLRLLPAVPFAGLLVVWVVTWAVARPSLATFPSLTQVLQTLGDLIESGELWRNIVASMGRWAIALVTATLSGVGLGLLAGLSAVVARIVEPLAIFFTAMSGIIWLPLAIVWFGLGTGMIVFVIWNSMFFVIFSNTLLGVRSVPGVLEDAIRTLGGSRLQIVTQVVLPGAFAHVLAGMRAGLGFGWRALLAAEIIGATAGLGAMIFRATDFLRSDVIVAGILVIGTIGLTIDRALLAPIERRTIERWGMVSATRRRLG